MKGFRHVAGQGIAGGCRSCGEDLPGGPWPTADEMFAVMKSAGWVLGPDLCPGCQDGHGKAEAAGLVSFRKDAWDNVVELAPGVWTEKPAPARETPGARPASARPKRRRRILKLL